MVDTGFQVPEAKLSRLIDPLAGGRPPMWDVTRPTTLFSGGGGLVSTAPDYLRFCQMLLNGGELDGVRILSPTTARRMTTNALPPGIRFVGGAATSVGPLGGSTFGLGFGIRSDAAFSGVPGSVGSFTWGGAWDIIFGLTRQLIAMQLLQVANNDGSRRGIFRNLADGAFRIPDQGLPVSATVPTTIDQVTLAAFAGTYRFASHSSRDKQEQVRASFGGLGIQIAKQDGRLRSYLRSRTRLPPRLA